MTAPLFPSLPKKPFWKNGHWVVDTEALDSSGHVPTHRLDQPTNRGQDEPWQQYEQRVLHRSSFSPDTAQVSSISALEPEVADSTRSLMNAARQAGVNLSPAETRRSQERQEMLFQKGRTSPGDVATWTLTSDHTPGRAVDFSGDDAAYQWLQQHAPEHGFSVMGSMDPGHVSMPGGPPPAPLARSNHGSSGSWGSDTTMGHGSSDAIVPNPPQAPRPAPFQVSRGTTGSWGGNPNTNHGSSEAIEPSPSPTVTAAPKPTNFPAAEPPVIAEDPEFEAWKAKQATPVPAHDPEFEAWKASKGPAVNHGASGSWSAEPTPPDDHSAFDNVSRAVLNGATFGAGNKISAAGNAILDRLQGQPYGQAYRQRLQDERDAEHAFAGNHPIVNAGLDLAGGLGSMVALGGASAPTELANVSRFARMLKAGGVGAGLGGFSGAMNADPDLSVADKLKAAGKGAALGGVGGAAMLPVGEAAGVLVSKTSIPRMLSALARKGSEVLPQGSRMQQGLQRAAGSIGPSGQAASQIGQRMEMDADAGFQPPGAVPGMPSMALDQAGPNVEGLAENIATRPGPGKTTIADALRARQAQMRPSVTGAFEQGTGVTGQQGEELTARLAREQEAIRLASENAKRIKAENAGIRESNRQVPQPVLPDPSQQWERQIGRPAPSGVGLLREAKDTQSANAAENFGAARAATVGQAVQSPTLDAVMETPIGKQAFAWARMQKGNRGLPLPTVDAPPKAPAGFSEDQWASIQQMLKDKAGAIRDPSGRLRVDLSKVADEHLDAEWQRLKQLNAQEESLHGSVKDAAYRTDYEELPRTERLGRKGQEDLPDADGTIDPERLVSDNKIITDYNKSVIARASRQKAMDRIQAEVNRRPVAGSDDSFDFGANVSESSGPMSTKEAADPETLHFMKQYLAKMARLGVHDGQAGMIATQAQGALSVWGKVKSEMPEVWQQADAAYAADARVKNMTNVGRNLMNTRVNPAGDRALHTSLDAIEQSVRDAPPHEQQAFRDAAQSAVADYFRSGRSRVGMVAQLSNPASEMSRRIVLATGDQNAPSAFRARLMAPPRHQWRPSRVPDIPEVSSESRIAQQGMDILRTKIAPSSSQLERSLPALDSQFPSMAPQDQGLFRTGAAAGVRGGWEGTGNSVQSPGRFFNASPERARQVAYAFPTPQASSEFQNTIAGWDRAAQQTQRLTGNSRTAGRAAEEASRDPMGSAIGQLFSGHPVNAMHALTSGMGREAATKTRQRLDQEIANILTSPDLQALPQAQRIALFRRKVSDMMRGSIPLGVVQQENQP